jgi:hypothetical protein
MTNYHKAVSFSPLSSFHTSHVHHTKQTHRNFAYLLPRYTAYVQNTCDLLTTSGDLSQLLSSAAMAARAAISNTSIPWVMETAVYLSQVVYIASMFVYYTSHEFKVPARSRDSLNSWELIVPMTISKMYFDENRWRFTTAIVLPQPRKQSSRLNELAHMSQHITYHACYVHLTLITSVFKQDSWDN